MTPTILADKPHQHKLQYLHPTSTASRSKDSGCISGTYRQNTGITKYRQYRLRKYHVQLYYHSCNSLKLPGTAAVFPSIILMWPGSSVIPSSIFSIPSCFLCDTGCLPSKYSPKILIWLGCHRSYKCARFVHCRPKVLRIRGYIHQLPPASPKIQYNKGMYSAPSPGDIRVLEIHQYDNIYPSIYQLFSRIPRKILG